MVLVFFIGQNAGLAHARLSIVDLEGGWQPITNEDRTLWIVFNGEIFNFFRSYLNGSSAEDMNLVPILIQR